MKKILSLATAVCLTSANITMAQDVPTETKGQLDITGYVDTYYQYNLNRPMSGANQGRIFDVQHNNFSLGLVQTMLTYTYGKATVVADLTVGPNADLGNFGNSGSAQMIKQAYVSYELTDELAFTMGQFGTHIGYELIDAPLNYNYSLSYLFGNGPFYHTGAKLNYDPNDRFGVMVGVVNGWDALQDFNDKKSVVAQAHFAPVEGFDIFANWVGGDEYNGLSAFGENRGSYTNLFDLTTSYQLTEAFKVGLNAAYGSFNTGVPAAEAIPGDPYSYDATWTGAALYLNYDLSDKFGLGVRGEHFSDPKGVRYFGPLEVTALTVTGDIRLADGKFNIKPEIRHDMAKDAFFEGSNGLAKKSQTTFGAAVIYAFDASIL